MSSITIRNLDPALKERLRIRARFAPYGGVDLELPPRGPDRDPPRFGCGLDLINPWDPS